MSGGQHAVRPHQLAQGLESVEHAVRAGAADAHPARFDLEQLGLRSFQPGDLAQLDLRLGRTARYQSGQAAEHGSQQRYFVPEGALLAQRRVMRQKTIEKRCRIFLQT